MLESATSTTAAGVAPRLHLLTMSRQKIPYDPQISQQFALDSGRRRSGQGIPGSTDKRVASEGKQQTKRSTAKITVAQSPSSITNNKIN